MTTNTRQIFIDTETTGLSAKQGHRIVEIAALEAIGGQLTGRRFHSYLNPEREIDARAQRVHGLTTWSLRRQPKFSEISAEFISFVHGAECLMHNAQFDVSFLDSELNRAGYEFCLSDIAQQVTCTLKLARKLYPGRPATLDDLIDHAGLRFQRQAHSALEDTRLLAEIYTKILRGKAAPSMAGGTINLKGRLTSNATPIVAAPIAPPDRLGMEKTIEMVTAQKDTFYYRDMHKRIIDYSVISPQRWEKIAGPLVYAVTEQSGTIRYLGKWVTPTPLRARWLRRKMIHHQERARNLYITELDAGRAPLSVWSISIAELRGRLPSSTDTFSDVQVATGLEALWIRRWKNTLLWNNRMEPLIAGFDDGEYWK